MPQGDHEGPPRGAKDIDTFRRVNLGCFVIPAAGVQDSENSTHLRKPSAHSHCTRRRTSTSALSCR